MDEGHFIEPDTHPFSTEDFEIKWGVHKKGKSHHTAPKKSNFAKTIEILISGHSRIYFPDQDVIISLKKPGQFVYWKEGVYHITEYLKDTTVLIIRWPSIKDDQEERDEL